MSQCVCGAVATQRCVDCRYEFCEDDGSTRADDFLAESLLSVIGGVQAHWPGPLFAADGSFRCDDCLAERLHDKYSAAVNRVISQMPPLPNDPFLLQCVLAQQGFELLEETVDRRPRTFAADSHRIGLRLDVPFNHVEDRGGLRRSRRSWRFPAVSETRSGPCWLQVFADGEWRLEPQEQGSAIMPDAAFALQAELTGARI